MKRIRRIVIAAVAVAVLAMAGVAYAATFKTPAQIVSDLTGKTVESLVQERASGKTYGTIASEDGVLDQFKAQMLEQKKAILDERVQNGTMTQQQEDEILNAIKANQANCDGTGNAGIGRQYGAGFGMGNGMGRGQGACNGTGTGNGMRYGRGMNR